MKDEILTVQPDDIYTHTHTQSAEIALECTDDAANVPG